MADGLHRLTASVEAAGGAAGGHGQPPGAPGAQLLLTRAKLAELITSVSPGERFDPPVELALVKLAEAFLVDVGSSAAELARHRRSKTIEPRDIQLFLEREYDMSFSGFVEAEEKTNVKMTHPTMAHQTRAAHATRAASHAAVAQQSLMSQTPHHQHQHHHQ